MAERRPLPIPAPEPSGPRSFPPPPLTSRRFPAGAQVKEARPEPGAALPPARASGWKEEGRKAETTFGTSFRARVAQSGGTARPGPLPPSLPAGPGSRSWGGPIAPHLRPGRRRLSRARAWGCNRGAEGALAHSQVLRWQDQRGSSTPRVLKRPQVRLHLRGRWRREAERVSRLTRRFRLARSVLWKTCEVPVCARDRVL